MARNHRTRKLSTQVKRKKPHYVPQVLIDHDADFAAIKIAPGIEAKSYIVDGILFSENKSGKIIEIQVLNLSRLKKSSKAVA